MKTTSSNKIHKYDKAPAISATVQLRAAGLAEEVNDDDKTGGEKWKRLADVRVFGFDGLIIIFDRDEETLTDERVAEIVGQAVEYTNSAYLATDVKVRYAGNGCRVSLPVLKNTGMHVGDKPKILSSIDMVLIADNSPDRNRAAINLHSIRQSQVGDRSDPPDLEDI